MSEKRKHDEVRSRNEKFSDKVSTRIWNEVSSEKNPYIAKAVQLHGYDIIELMKKRSFIDVFFLLFKGEIPEKLESELLQSLMIALINPGPRHPATRAAMNAGVGKTNPGHILPISVSLMSGDYLGGGLIERSMRFFRKNQKNPPEQVVEPVIGIMDSKPKEWEQSFPGFGSVFGGIDLVAKDIVETLLKMNGRGAALMWGNKLSKLLEFNGLGWTMPGVAAAVFADLGFQPRAGICLFQLMCSPGLVAHGLELANKPITAMPYVSDENYVIEK